MKSEWKVSSQVIGGKTVYTVFRWIDEDATHHSGNREYPPDDRSNYYDRKEAEYLAKRLNREAGKKENP